MDNSKKPFRPGNRGNSNKRSYKSIGFIAILILFGLVMIAAYNQSGGSKTIPLTQAISDANAGRYAKVEISGNQIDITKKGEQRSTLKTYKDPNSTLKEDGFNTSKMQVAFKPQSSTGSTVENLLIGLLPVVVISIVLYIMLRSAQGQGNQALSFGKSRARLYGNEKDKVTFEDIAGSNEAKQDLEEVVEFLKYPKKFAHLGARIPKGVLLVGPPGTGKTMLARAVAGEANVPFFSISGSEFVEMFVGVGASRVRDLFAKAKKNSPCIIFVEMDGFEQGQNVIVLAATNRADVLDPALLRPGRFDRRVDIGLPDRKDREAILKVHFEKKPTAAGVDLDALAAKSAGSSGADLANIANESAIIAARLNHKEISNSDVTAAFEKVAIGPERKSKVMSDKEKEITAFHEAGHAVVGHVLPDSDLVHKVTIIPRGGTGGVTWFIPEHDKSYHSLVEYKDVLARMVGGRIAEEIIYGADHITTGAGNDLQKAAELARDMVINQGMGKKLRNQVFHVDDGMMIDRIVHERDYSDETAKVIDDEVEALISEATVRAHSVIKANLEFLRKLKDRLLEKETVEAEEVKDLLKGSHMPKAAALY
jgi:cell division protease FtsH